MTRKGRKHASIAPVEAAEQTTPVAAPATPEREADQRLPEIAPTKEQDLGDLTAEAILTHARSVRANKPGWWYLNSHPDLYKVGEAKRFSVRVALLEGRGDETISGRAYRSIKFVGLCYAEQDGALVLDESACWGANPDDRFMPTVRLKQEDGTTGQMSTIGPGGLAPQCADSREALITIYANPSSQPCLEITGGKAGGSYTLTSVFDNETGDLIA